MLQVTETTKRFEQCDLCAFFGGTKDEVRIIDADSLGIYKNDQHAKRIQVQTISDICDNNAEVAAWRRRVYEKAQSAIDEYHDTTKHKLRKQITEMRRIWDGIRAEYEDGPCIYFVGDGE